MAAWCLMAARDLLAEGNQMALELSRGSRGTQRVEWFLKISILGLRGSFLNTLYQQFQETLLRPGKLHLKWNALRMGLNLLRFHISIRMARKRNELRRKNFKRNNHHKFLKLTIYTRNNVRPSLLWTQWDYQQCQRATLIANKQLLSAQTV